MIGDRPGGERERLPICIMTENISRKFLIGQAKLISFDLQYLMLSFKEVLD